MTENSCSSPNSLRVCLVALHAYGAIDNLVTQGVGGTETRAWLLARGLARYAEDIETQFVVRTSRLSKQTTIENVTVVPYHDPNFELWQEAGHFLQKQSSFPYIVPRKLSHRLLTLVPQLLATWKHRKDYSGGFRIDERLPESDLYITFGVQGHSARVLETAKQFRKPSILFLGSDGDLDESYVLGNQAVNPYGDSAELCRQIIDSADTILCQTNSQKALLKKRFGRYGTVIANPIDLQTWSATASEIADANEVTQLKTSLPDKPYVLWIGRADPVHKRPMLCVEIARKCPEILFVMIMNPRDDTERQRVENALPQNVSLIPKVSPQLMPTVFGQSLCLLNTSSLEGFANTFLQAAAMGKPILSMCVDAPLLSEGKAGLCLHSEDIELAASTLKIFATMPDKSDTFDPERSRIFLNTHHSLQAIVEQFSHIIKQTATAEIHP